MITQKIIVFDLDGTLVHSAPDLHAAANVALTELGRPELDLETITSFVGNGVEMLMRRSLAATGGEEDRFLAKALERFMAYYADNMTTLTRPYPGVVDCLDRLRADGAKLGVCTNKPTGPARVVCEELGLTQYFDVIEGAEEGRPKKPDPASLWQVIEALGGSPGEAVYFGDSKVDFDTARNAGVAFRFFSGGYLNDPLPELSASERFDDWDLALEQDLK